MTQFQYYISKGHPASISITNSSIGHRYVVAGYQDSKLYLIDPWKDEVNAWYSYQALVTGTTLPSVTNGKYVNTVLVV